MDIIKGGDGASGRRFALVVSAYHAFVTDRLQSGAIAALLAAGASLDEVTVVRVPGAFEIPLAARRVAQTGRYDAVICLGCLIRGETPHFEFIAAAVAQGVTSAAGATGVPMTFGVLTTNSAEEALARTGEGPANKGYEAATAAVAMASVVAALARQPSATNR